MLSERFRRASDSLVALVVIVGLFAAACVDQATPPSATPTSSPSASNVSGDQLASWIRFRTVYRLRADPVWALEVSNDPRAVGAELGVPLLPSELEQVAAANASAQSLSGPARAYANGFPTEFAGLWLEGPVVVLAFSDALDIRRAEVEGLFGQRVVVRPARYAIQELDAFIASVNKDRDWFPTIGAKLHGIDLDELSNSIVVHYLAPDRAVEPLIRARFVQPDWLQLAYDGPLPWTGPLGGIELTVVDRQGSPVGVECLLYTVDPRVRHEDLRGFSDGKCVFQAIPAVEWLVDVNFEAAGITKTVTKTLVVPADRTVRSTLVVDP